MEKQNLSLWGSHEPPPSFVTSSPGFKPRRVHSAKNIRDMLNMTPPLGGFDLLPSFQWNKKEAPLVPFSVARNDDLWNIDEQDIKTISRNFNPALFFSITPTEAGLRGPSHATQLPLQPQRWGWPLFFGKLAHQLILLNPLISETPTHLLAMRIERNRRREADRGHGRGRRDAANERRIRAGLNLDAENKEDMKDEKEILQDEKELYDEGLPHYYYPAKNERELAEFASKFPYCRWRAQYNPIDKYPLSPHFVGLYHNICETLGLAPDIHSEAFSANSFYYPFFSDRAMNAAVTLRLSCDGIFLAKRDGTLFSFGASTLFHTGGLSVHSQILDHTIFLTQQDPLRQYSPSITEKHQAGIKQLTEYLIAQSSRVARSEKMMTMARGRFAWACQELGLDKTEYRTEYDSIMQTVATHNDFRYVPMMYVNDIVAKMKQSANTRTLGLILERLNRLGALDAYLATLIDDPLEYPKISTLLNSILQTDFYTLQVGAEAFDICAEHLNSKKITYQVKMDSIIMDRLGNCTERLAFKCIGPTLPEYEPQVSRTCPHNSINALQTRFICDYKEMKVSLQHEQASSELLAKALATMMATNGLPFEMMSYVDTIESMDWPAALKKSAYELLPEIEGQEASFFDTKTRAFAKWEELKNKTSINTRLIQGFSLGFSLITARLVKSVYRALKPVLSQADAPIALGSMMTNEQIGRWQKDSNFKGLYTFDADGDTYDATTRLPAVLMVYEIYKQLVGGDPAFGIHCLTKSLRIRGSLFAHGVKYQLPISAFDAGWAPMASGRADTTLTNSLLRIREGLFYLQQAGLAGKVLASGDDLRIASDQPFPVSKLGFFGAMLGRVEKVESNSTENGVFLRKLFYPIGNDLVPGVLPGRILPRLGWISAKVKASKRLGVLKGDCIGRLTCDAHVPIVREACLRLLSLLSDKKAIHTAQSRRIHTICEKQHMWDEETLVFMASAYDCSTEDILDCIEEVSNMELNHEYRHPLFRKMFLADTTTSDGSRQGLVASAGHAVFDRSNVTALLASTTRPNTLWASIGQSLWAAATEEGLKWAIAVVAFLLCPTAIAIPIALIAPAIMALIESNTIYGIHVVDFFSRFAAHSGMMVANLFLPGLGVCIHALHNLLAHFNAPVLFFVQLSTNLKILQVRARSVANLTLEFRHWIANTERLNQEQVEDLDFLHDPTADILGIAETVSGGSWAFARLPFVPYHRYGQRDVGLARVNALTRFFTVGASQVTAAASLQMPAHNWSFLLGSSQNSNLTSASSHGLVSQLLRRTTNEPARVDAAQSKPGAPRTVGIPPTTQSEVSSAPRLRVPSLASADSMGALQARPSLAKAPLGSHESRAWEITRCTTTPSTTELQESPVLGAAPTASALSTVNFSQMSKAASTSNNSSTAFNQEIPAPFPGSAKSRWPSKSTVSKDSFSSSTPLLPTRSTQPIQRWERASWQLSTTRLDHHSPANLKWNNMSSVALDDQAPTSFIQSNANPKRPPSNNSMSELVNFPRGRSPSFMTSVPSISQPSECRLPPRSGNSGLRTTSNSSNPGSRRKPNAQSPTTRVYTPPPTRRYSRRSYQSKATLKRKLRRMRSHFQQARQANSYLPFIWPATPTGRRVGSTPSSSREPTWPP